MSLFKCKMCGGDLEIAEGITIAECEYCGTKQTVPKAMDENMQNLFNRANTLRIKSEFDKAEKLYEKIIQADTTQSEAYWGLILCKYGIEYVDDPATFKKIPTCHRTSYDSIIADDDYKSALQNADIAQRTVYEQQANEIDRIQKEILALAQKEETYDVFICYKETDADGRRTQDSVIANDIYYQLTNEGFKVFYAAITLEGKLGSAYEPIIFAALHSAKVMLSIGTKPEYFNAVWVKNEWSRYLKIIKKDRSKLLIPCYRDMDAYELPDEFAHLQAQDMSKIGFINDVVRGIKKVIKNDMPKQTTVLKETVVTAQNVNIAPLLKRAFMFLEDGDFERADDFCEQVLNQDPECVRAYLGKLMAELRVNTQDKLKDCAEPFDHFNNYQKTLRFCDESLKNTLEGYIDYIKKRNENAYLENIYNQAKWKMVNATTAVEYSSAANAFKQIQTYKDSEELISKCLENAEIVRKDTIYFLAISKKDANTVQGYEDALRLFSSIRGWKDADEMIEEVKSELSEKEHQLKLARKKKKRQIIMITLVCSLVVVCSVALCIIMSSVSKSRMDNKYTKAISFFDEGSYAEGAELLCELEEISYAFDIQQLSYLSLYADQMYLDGFVAEAQTVANIAESPNADLYKYVVNGKYKKALQGGLTHISIPNTVTSIDDDAFYGCTGLTSITIPDSVTSIGDYAFSGCTGLTSITIPDSVTSINQSAFSGCTGLTSITIPDSVTSIGGSAFEGCAGLTSITIPNSVTSIDYAAFYGCKGLTSITIPNSVTSIGGSAFSGCTGLTSITIPNSVTSIGYSAFSGCTGLASITLPFVGNGLNKTHFGYIFGASTYTGNESNVPPSLKTVVITGSSNIYNYAFYGCTGLTSITIPNSVTSIGYGMFSNCSKLTSINFKGTKAEWNAISKGSRWDSDTGKYTIYCTDGTITK